MQKLQRARLAALVAAAAALSLPSIGRAQSSRTTAPQVDAKILKNV